jgi:translation initiation factor 3 subunit E
LIGDPTREENRYIIIMPGEEWDLTGTISPYLDRHMVFPLLEFVDGLIADGKIGYEAKDVAAARLELLQPTHMIDYAIDIHKKDGSPVPQALLDRKASVMQELEALKNKCAPLEKLAANAEEKVRWC